MSESEASRILAVACERPVAFQRAFVDICNGNINAALMLSQACYWQRRSPQRWWWKKREGWEAEIGLQRKAQENARKILRDLGVLEEELRGIPPKMFYRVNFARLATLLSGLADNSEGGFEGGRDDEESPETEPVIMDRSDSTIGTVRTIGSVPAGPPIRKYETKDETKREELVEKAPKRAICDSGNSLHDQILEAMNKASGKQHRMTESKAKHFKRIVKQTPAEKRTPQFFTDFLKKLYTAHFAGREYEHNWGCACLAAHWDAYLDKYDSGVPSEATRPSGPPIYDPPWMRLGGDTGQEQGK